MRRGRRRPNTRVGGSALRVVAVGDRPRVGRRAGGGAVGVQAPGILLTPGVLVAVGVLPTAGLVEVIGAPVLLVPSGAIVGSTAMALLTPVLMASRWFGVMVPGAGVSDVDEVVEPASGPSPPPPSAASAPLEIPISSQIE